MENFSILNLITVALGLEIFSTNNTDTISKIVIGTAIGIVIMLIISFLIGGYVVFSFNNICIKKSNIKH